MAPRVRINGVSVLSRLHAAISSLSLASSKDSTGEASRCFLFDSLQLLLVLRAFFFPLLEEPSSDNFSLVLLLPANGELLS